MQARICSRLRRRKAPVTGDFNVACRNIRNTCIPQYCRWFFCSLLRADGDYSVFLVILTWHIPRACYVGFCFVFLALGYLWLRVRNLDAALSVCHHSWALVGLESDLAECTQVSIRIAIVYARSLRLVKVLLRVVAINKDCWKWVRIVLTRSSWCRIVVVYEIDWFEQGFPT